MSDTEKFDLGITCPNGHEGVVTWEEFSDAAHFNDREKTLGDVSTGFTLMDWKTRMVRRESCGVLFQVR